VLLKLWRLAYVHLILPFQVSTAPIPQVAWGAAIGMFIGLTPTVGVQMYISALLWIICRYVFRFRFNLPIAIAMVWISNPVTVVPLYYGYLKTGEWLLAMWGHVGTPTDYAGFKAIMKGAEELSAHALWDRIVRGLAALFWLFGWPIVVGGVAWAIPLAILTHPVTTFGLLRYRRRLAEQEGLSYQEWKAQRVRPE